MDCLISMILYFVEYLTIGCQFCLYLILLPLTPLIKPVWNIVARKLDIHHDPGSSGNNNKARPSDIKVLNWKCYPFILSHGLIGSLEAWFRGWWDVEDLEEFLSKLAVHPKFCRKVLKMDAGLFTGLYNIRWNWFNIQTKERAKRYCTTSYDLGSDFFSSFLDSFSGLFSVAYYGRGASTLQEAQIEKMSWTAANLKLKPGMRVLDLGCGFGGFSHYLAKEHGVSVLALTNNSDMASATRERCFGLDVTVLEADWRDLSLEIASFDRVVEIQVLFHVGRHNVDAHFRQISKWLKPDGICVIQDFTVRGGDIHNFSAFHQYWYPGCYILRLDQILGISERYFCLEKFTDLTPDMELTYSEWLRRLVKNWPKIEHKYDEKYFKLHRILFGASVELARSGFLSAEQFVFRKLRGPFPL